MMKNDQDISIGDIAVAGAELSDEQLLAARGGLVIISDIQQACSCAVGGGYDFDAMP
jgi:hypothetical protein